FRGSITQRLISLSTLRRGGLPPTAQDSLPAAGPALPDGVSYPQGFDERFHIFEMILLSRATWRKVRAGFRFSGSIGGSPRSHHGADGSHGGRDRHSESGRARCPDGSARKPMTTP